MLACRVIVGKDRAAVPLVHREALAECALAGDTDLYSYGLHSYGLAECALAGDTDLVVYMGMVSWPCIFWLHVGLCPIEDGTLGRAQGLKQRRWNPNPKKSPHRDM